MTPQQIFALAFDLIRHKPAVPQGYQPTLTEMEVAAVMQPDELHIAAYYVPPNKIAAVIIRAGEPS